MAELISYSFTKENSSDIGTEWDDHGSLSGQFEILSNMAHVTSGTNGNDGAETVNSITTPVDQYAECTFGTTSSSGVGASYGVYCRLATGSHTGYRLIGSGSGFELMRFNAGSTSLSSGTGTTFTTSDIIKLECTGSGATVTLKMFKNGTQFGGDITDSTGSRITSANRVGIAYSSSDAVASGIASFRAGSIGSPDISVGLGGSAATNEHGLTAPGISIGL